MPKEIEKNLPVSERKKYGNLQNSLQHDFIKSINCCSVFLVTLTNRPLLLQILMV